MTNSDQKILEKSAQNLRILVQSKNPPPYKRKYLWQIFDRHAGRRSSAREGKKNKNIPSCSSAGLL